MKAASKHIRMSPQKMRAVLNLVRGAEVSKAVDVLKFCRRRAAGPVLKLVKSAVANAVRKGGIDVDNLYIKYLNVGNGPILKRWRARSKGIANKVLKRTSHIWIELGEK